MNASKICVEVILLFLISFTSAVAQITIAPTSVFINTKEQFGSFTVINSSDKAQEVSISFLYGYPTTDSTGNVKMIYKDSTKGSFSRSIVPFVRGFPTNFLLNPGQRQSVRIAVRPNRDLKDGTYWGRIKVTSNPQSPPLEATKGNQIRAQINFRFEQIIALIYRNGQTNTGIKFNKLYTQASDSVYHVFADVERTGNSPFHGTVSLSVKKDGNTVVRKQSSIAVYLDFLKRFDIPYPKIEKGVKYEATVTFRSQRSDISSENLITVDPISKSTTFMVQQ